MPIVGLVVAPAGWIPPPALPGGTETETETVHSHATFTPTMWLAAPVVAGTMLVAEVTTDPWARLAEYGVMGITLGGLAWWTLYRQKQTDATSKEQTTAILELTKSSVAAQTTCNSTMTACRDAISEVREAIDRSTVSMRSVENTALENRKVIEKLCEKISK